MSLPMHIRNTHVHFGNLFPVLSVRKHNQKSKNNKNKNKKFNTMANDIPRTVLKKNEQQQRFASFVVSDSCCLLLLGLSMKLNHAT